MNSRTVIHVATCGALGVIAGVSFLLPDTLTVPTLSAGPGGTEVRLVGTVRDFLSAHPDFDVVPAGGIGQYADNVQVTLDIDGHPVFNRGSDASGPLDDRIAHWKLDDGAGLVATDEMGSNPGSVLNGATWTAGMDGGAMHFDGVDDYVDVPSSPEMQITGDITFVGWFKLDADFDSSSPATLVIMEKFLDTEHDFHLGLAGNDYNRPEVPRGALVFKVENGPDSDHYRYKWTNRTSWTAGVWYHFAAALTSSDTSVNTLFINGVDDTSAADAGGVGFIDTGYDAPMRIGGRTIDYNGIATDIYFEGVIDDVMIFDRALTGDDFTGSGGYKVLTPWEDSAGHFIAPHLFGSPLVDACGAPIADVAGTKGADDTGGITDATSFAQWFRDIPGVNQSVGHTITLTRDGAGVWSYLDDDFRPVDGRLLGNEGAPRNSHFTYHIRATFEYKQCWAQFLEFQGGDGVWAFIDGALVLDLGGVGTPDEQFLALDRLGLDHGSTYELDLFYGQRNPTTSVFRLRTTLDLSTDGFKPIVSAMFD